MVPTALAKAVAKGDLTGIDNTGSLVKASETTWNTDLATTRTAFVALYAGISAQTKPANGNTFGNAGANALKTRVNPGGVYPIPCKAGTYKLGDRVGPAKQAGNALEDQIVEGVATDAQSIGRVVGREGVDPGVIEVELMSTLLPASK